LTQIRARRLRTRACVDATGDRPTAATHFPLRKAPHTPWGTRFASTQHRCRNPRECILNGRKRSRRNSALPLERAQSGTRTVWEMICVDANVLPQPDKAFLRRRKCVAATSDRFDPLSQRLGG